MKIDRLLGILTVLLQNDLTTAGKLASRFEVSARTINRDVEDLCKAGIPLVTLQGKGGGIRIADGYKIDKTLFTTREMQAILDGLKSLESISKNDQYSIMAEKIYGKREATTQDMYDSKGHILIDLASYYKGSLVPKIEMIKSAIESSSMINFLYYSTTGENNRTIEPYLIIFQWSGWYLYGFCTLRNEFRLFKLNRLMNLNITDEKFIKKTVPKINMDIDQIYKNHIILVADFSPKVKWRLVDEYGVDSFKQTEQGKLRFTGEFANMEFLLTWLMGYGDDVTIISPSEVLEEYLKRIESIRNRYLI